MRRFICLLFSCLLLVGLTPKAYAAGITATVSTEPVTLNGVAIDNRWAKYPLLVYKDITYFPMTYHLCNFLGVSSRWDAAAGTLYIDRTGEAAAYTAETSSTRRQGRVTATRVEYPVVINGTTFDSKNANWPLLNYSNVTYFPLTWALAAEELGWDYQWDAANGLRIDSGTGVVNPPADSGNSGPSDADAEDGMVMQGIWRGFGPFLYEIDPKDLTIELWGDWTVTGMQSAILKGMTDYIAQDSYLSRYVQITDVKISYSFQFPSQVWSGMELKVPFTAVAQSTSVYTLPSGKTYVPSGTTNEQTVTVRLTGQGIPSVDSTFQAGQAMYRQLEKCTEVGEISVEANTVFSPMELIQTKITRNLASAGLSNQYFIQSLSLGAHRTVLSSGETMTVDFEVSFATQSDATITIDNQISKQATFRTK